MVQWISGTLVECSDTSVDQLGQWFNGSLVPLDQWYIIGSVEQKFSGSGGSVDEWISRTLLQWSKSSVDKLGQWLNGSVGH